MMTPGWASGLNCQQSDPAHYFSACLFFPASTTPIIPPYMDMVALHFNASP